MSPTEDPERPRVHETGTREQIIQDVEREQAEIHAATRSDPREDPSTRRHLGVTGLTAATVAAVLGIALAVVLFGVALDVSPAGTVSLAVCFMVVFGALGWLLTAPRDDGFVNRRIRGRRPRGASPTDRS
jgi:hypothetical protein